MFDLTGKLKAKMKLNKKKDYIILNNSKALTHIVLFICVYNSNQIKKVAS